MTGFTRVDHPVVRTYVGTCGAIEVRVEPGAFAWRYISETGWYEPYRLTRRGRRPKDETIGCLIAAAWGRGISAHDADWTLVGTEYAA